MPEQPKEIARRPNGTFAKGMSPNPGGRSKEVAEVVQLARDHTPLAITQLVDIANNPKANAQARVKACEVLLDRAWGRPAQALDVTGMPSQVMAFTLIAGGAPEEIEGDVVDDG